MLNFTNFDLANMNLDYGLANGTTLESRHIYLERYPGRLVLDNLIFSNIYCCLYETVFFEKLQTKRENFVLLEQHQSAV